MASWDRGCALAQINRYINIESDEFKPLRAGILHAGRGAMDDGSGLETFDQNTEG
jgi:hypothetical protein